MPMVMGLTVYLDLVFLLNAGVNYALLRGAQRLFGTAGVRRRSIIGAVLGGLYASATFLPGFSFLTAVPWRILVFLLLVVIAYGWSAPTFYLGSIFLGESLVLSGVVQLLSTLFHTDVWLVGGTVYYAVSFGAVVLCAGLLYFVSGFVMQGTLSGKLLETSLMVNGKTIHLTMLHDTGNSLRDPFSGQALPVVDSRVLENAFPGVQLENVTASMEQIKARYPQLAPRLIPVRTVGMKNGLLLAVRCECLHVRGKPYPGKLIAISPTPISENGNYRGLIGDSL